MDALTANAGNDLPALLPLRGRPWIAARDRIARHRFDPAALRRRFARGADARLRTTAAILAAWKEHGKRFRGFLRQIDAVDVKTESRTRLGLHGPVGRLSSALIQDFGLAALPFCWERAVKLCGTEESWRDAVFFHAMKLMPHRDSVEPLLWAVETATDAAQVDAFHQTLIAQPFGDFRPRLEALQKSHGWRKFVMDDLLARIAGPLP